MRDTAILITGNGIGQGEPALRQRLANNYFLTLAESGLLPQALLFYGEGVKLCCDNSLSLDALRQLANAGVPITICRTCLDYYGRLEAVEIGDIGNMLQIVEAQHKASKVITV